MKLFLLPLALWLSSPPVKAPLIELKGYFACLGSLLLPAGNTSLACYASTQRSCRNGVLVLAYEKRVNKSTEKTRFAIVDTVRLHVSAPRHEVMITSCSGASGKTSQYFVLFQADESGSKYLHAVQRVWGVSAQGQLVEVPAKTLKCLNQDTAD
jgi:hypothetical protein